MAKRKKRRAPKGGWKKYMSRIRGMKKSRKGGSVERKRSRRKTRASSRRRVTHRRSARAVLTLSNPRRHRRRGIFRRLGNPRFSVGGIMGRIKSGAIDGLWIVGGKAVTNAIPSMIGLSQTGALGMGIKALSAVAAGYVFGFVSPNAGKLATAAGFAAIYEPFIKGLNLPLISSALAADDYLSYGAYPDELSSGGVGAYPEMAGESDYAQQY